MHMSGAQTGPFGTFLLPWSKIPPLGESQAAHPNTDFLKVLRNSN